MTDITKNLLANSDKGKKRLIVHNKFTPKERRRYESLSSDEQRQIDRLGAAFGTIRLFVENVKKSQNHGSGNRY